MLADAVMEDNPSAKSEASWILGLIGSPEAFDPLLELSHAETWQQRSSALNAVGKLNDLTVEDLARLEARIHEVLGDPGEVFYVRKDAVYACGRQTLCGSLGLLIGVLEDGHQAVRFSAAEAIKDLAESGCGHVAGMLAASLPGMNEIGVAAALHAAGGLDPEAKLDIAEALTASKAVLSPHEEVALAGLLSGLEPETPRDSKRLDAVRRTLPADSWRVVQEDPSISSTLAR
jgi:HEAT repeat protein